MTSEKLSFRITITACLCMHLFLIGGMTTAQQQGQLEHLLNTSDTPSNWAKTPVSGIHSGQPQFGPPAASPAFNQSQNFSQPGSPPFTRQQILQTLLGGSEQTNSSPKKKNISSSGTAYSDYQEAENQASRAHNAQERAHYEHDKGNRESDASEAYYAANSAREASDRVYQASLNGDAMAKQYAGEARAAADRARATADQARYDADTYNQ